ncbi:GtrA family protein [Acidipropionibacterium timonense]|uniref:GtrA family protein n=1 Tax=Acidipropionibacterium timonense TaxID=2161818 RepID=UPI0010315E1D|nr:GtrA family protein [Acidipropionibacterium timonense]
MLQSIHSFIPAAFSDIPVTFIGYCIINGLGFLLDISLLALFYQGVRLPYSLAVSLGYGTSVVYGFIVNRWLNFQAHGHVGRQSGRYAVTIALNYLIFIVAFSTLLHHLGVQAQVARVVSAAMEGIFVYVMMSLWVFRGVRQRQLL